MAGRKIRDEADARASLAAAATSGLKRSEWTRRQGIDGRSLNAWRLNLKRAGVEGVARVPVRLVELVAAKAPAVVPARYLVRCGELEVEVDGGFDDETLLRLLRVVAAC